MIKEPLHKRKRSEASLSDEYETPDDVFNSLCEKYNMFPKLDVCADFTNTKCKIFHGDSLNTEWYIRDENHIITLVDAWCNPPQTKCKEFVLKANEQWKRHNINIMMIIPANVLTTKYFYTVIDNVEYHPIKGRITFLFDGKISKFPARNGYFVVIWRKVI